MGWFKWFFYSPIEIVDEKWIENANEQELILKLKSGMISVRSGHRIVTELLERILKEKNDKLT